MSPAKAAAGTAGPRWHALARQYHDPTQIVLFAAGIGSLYPLKQSARASCRSPVGGDRRDPQGGAAVDAAMPVTPVI